MNRRLPCRGTVPASVHRRRGRPHPAVRGAGVVAVCGPGAGGDLTMEGDIAGRHSLTGGSGLLGLLVTGRVGGLQGSSLWVADLAFCRLLAMGCDGLERMSCGLCADCCPVRGQTWLMPDRSGPERTSVTPG
ncbi:hypothetical protein GCM10027162_33430 [Streptomyces incanus]